MRSLIAIVFLFLMGGCNTFDNNIDVLGNDPNMNTEMSLSDFSNENSNKNECKEWIDQNKLNIDINNYRILESYIQYVVATCKKILDKSFEGSYEIRITYDGSFILFDGNIVDTNDPLYVELSNAFPGWESVQKKNKISDLVLTIKDGEIIRTIDPAEYLK